MASTSTSTSTSTLTYSPTSTSTPTPDETVIVVNIDDGNDTVTTVPLSQKMVDKLGFIKGYMECGDATYCSVPMEKVSPDSMKIIMRYLQADIAAEAAEAAAAAEVAAAAAAASTTTTTSTAPTLPPPRMEVTEWKTAILGTRVMTTEVRLQVLLAANYLGYEGLTKAACCYTANAIKESIELNPSNPTGQIVGLFNAEPLSQTITTGQVVDVIKTNDWLVEGAGDVTAEAEKTSELFHGCIEKGIVKMPPVNPEAMTVSA